MEDDLLEDARRQAEKADTSICAAALLRIARAESAGDVSRARRTLLEGLDAVQRLPSPVREHLLEEGQLRRRYPLNYWVGSPGPIAPGPSDLRPLTLSRP